MRRLCLPAIAASVSLLGLVAGTAAASASAPVAAPVVERNSAVCFSGCQLALQYVAFAGDDDVERGEKLSASPSAIDGPKLPALSVSDEAHVLRASGPCANSLARRALLRCAHEYCTPDVRDAGMRNVNATCVRRGLGGFGHVPLVSRPVGRVAFGQRGMWNTVVIPDADFFERAYFTEMAVSYVGNRHRLYASCVFMYWLAVVFVGVSYRVFGAAWARCLPSLPPPKTPTDEPAVYTPPAAGPSSWLRRFVLLPATVGHRKAQPFGWFTVPPRAQSATLALFVVLNVWFTVDGYYFTDKNIYFPTYQKQFWRYLSDRTGFISYANFPMVWVFGLRNNLLLWLTGWDFGTYNNFHRWAARVATVQAVIHSVGYTVLVFIDGGWPYFFFFFTKFFWWTGEIAVLGMCALLPLSLYWMRRNMYEVFLALHIALSAIVLVCMWGHLTIFKSQTNSVFWLCCIFWIGDRLGRVLRVVAFNPRFWSSRATVSWSSAANMLRLNVPIASSLYQPQAGTFYYIYVLNSRYFWQSHPFTVATISSSTAATTTASPLPDDSSTPLLGHVAAPKPAEMTFLIRPYAGFTNRLKAIAQHGPATLRVLIEGPYGHTAPLATFNTCLFLVGGSGIAAPLSHLRRLVAAQRAVRIVWAVRESALVTEVLACDFAGLLCAIGNNRSAISLDIYVTSDEARDVIAPQGIRVLAGRPEVRCEVEAAAAQTGAGRLAVLACGPAVMADDARAAVVEAVARGYTQTEYFEEAFNW